MNDVAHNFGSLPILDREREQYHSEVRSFHAHRLDHTRRRLRIWSWLAVTSWAIVAILAGVIAMMLPLKTIAPFYVVAHDDGTTDVGTCLECLGPDMAEKIVSGSVWRYVEERESYSYSDAQRRYDLVSLMSAEDVQREYQQWFLHAKDGPQMGFGKQGHISVQEISTSPVRDGVKLVRFWRIATKTGEQPQKASVTATVEYQVLPGIPKKLFLGGDHAGIIVTRYMTEDNTP